MLESIVQTIFNNWERRLAAATTDRVVRPFDWGLDWIPVNGERAVGSAALPAETEAARSSGSDEGREQERLQTWIDTVMSNTDAFFTPPPTSEFTIEPQSEGDRLTFPSALETPHPENNTVSCRYFRARPQRGGRRRAAVLVLPQWNSNPGGHVGLCRLLAWSGMSALRLTLPYHDRRMPPELHRADYIVSANVARTVQVCRQAVLDARRAIGWLASRGYDRIGILGTSLGSCLALLTTAHEPLIRAQALNHISPFFADVVWRGLSTEHVRAGLDGRIDLPRLRELWKPISPRWYLERLRDRQTLLVYARYDLSFPVDLSESLVQQFRQAQVPHEVAVLRCGHYSTGKAPFKYADGWILTKFLLKHLNG